MFPCEVFVNLNDGLFSKEDPACLLEYSKFMKMSENVELLTSLCVIK